MDSKLELMVQGHEIWLERSASEGRDVELAVVFGHNMSQDGIADIKRVSSAVYSPDGGRLIPDLRSEDARHMLSFRADKDGYYTAVVDLSTVVISQVKDGYMIGPRFKFKDVVYAGAFHQMAKMIVPCGQVGKYRGDPMHGILELVPSEAGYQVGDEAVLKVYYEGLPLPSAEVKAVSRSEGKEMAVVASDKDGVARIPITRDGEWMFLARHRDPRKKISDEFDESVFVCTLVMEAR